MKALEEVSGPSPRCDDASRSDRSRACAELTDGPGRRRDRILDAKIQICGAHERGEESGAECVSGSRRVDDLRPPRPDLNPSAVRRPDERAGRAELEGHDP